MNENVSIYYHFCSCVFNNDYRYLRLRRLCIWFMLSVCVCVCVCVYVCVCVCVCVYVFMCVCIWYENMSNICTYSYNIYNTHKKHRSKIYNTTQTYIIKNACTYVYTYVLTLKNDNKLIKILQNSWSHFRHHQIF